MATKIKKVDVLSFLENANMLEVSELITEIEEKFGVSAAAPVAIAGAAATGSAAAATASATGGPVGDPRWMQSTVGIDNDVNVPKEFI